MYLLKPTTFRAPGMVFEIAKTFQNLSIPFIFLHPILPVREKVPAGDPNISAHPAVNRAPKHTRCGSHFSRMQLTNS
jgi:hypothetical protein